MGYKLIISLQNTWNEKKIIKNCVLKNNKECTSGIDQLSFVQTNLNMMYLDLRCNKLFNRPSVAWLFK